MATTTTNYGFDVPTSSDLVKNGATAISTLGQDIDTFLFRPITQNAVINGAMTNWQRGTSFASSGYTADRWYLTSPGSNTVSRSTDTPSGFNYSLKWDISGAYPLLSTYIELPATGVKGQYTGTWTVSFWAKGSASFSVELDTAFNNGSARTDRVAIPITGSPIVALTTTWTKYSFVLDLTSPTINANNKAVEVVLYSASGTNSMYLTGVQFEQGSQATPFSLAGGTIQGELAACQRYFWRAVNGTGAYVAMGQNYATTNGLGIIQYPVTMRVGPSVTVSNATHFSQTDSTAGSRQLSAFSADSFTNTSARLTTTCGAFMTAGNATLINSTNASATLDFGAEL